MDSTLPSTNLSSHIPSMLTAEIALSLPAFASILIGAGALFGVLLVGCSVLVLATRRKAMPPPARRLPAGLLYLLFLLAVAVLGVSSFWTILSGNSMSGYALMTHMFAAGAFVFLLLAVALLYLPRPAQSGPAGPDRWWLTRFSVWWLVGAGIVAVATMLTAMLPLAGTDTLHALTAVHRYAGLAVVVAAGFHLFALLCTRMGWR